MYMYVMKVSIYSARNKKSLEIFSSFSCKRAAI